MNPYLQFVKNIQADVESVRGLSVSGKTEPAESDEKVLLFSPHPDDECITGLLPLRLMREAGMKIINVPVTFGSNEERRAARAAELKNACDYLGFQILDENSAFTPRSTEPRRSRFQGLEKEDAVEILKETQPQGVFVPHSKDWNVRHVETHQLVLDALEEMPNDFSCAVIETEFWHPMDDPNLMVEADAETLADLVAALSLHIGEVARNPYHRQLPAWMIDNVRRGGEVVGGQGGAAPDFTFATLYRLSRWENGKLFQCLEKTASPDAVGFQTLEKSRFIGMNDDLNEKF